MLVSKENILNYIPQRIPFVMIDNLINATENEFQSTFQIVDSSIFLENNILSESALVENIAQTSAAGFGYVNSQKGKEAGGLGFIGAITKLTVSDKAKLGDLITTKVTVITSFDAIHLIEGIASSNGRELVKCQMKIVVN